MEQLKSTGQASRQASRRRKANGEAGVKIERLKDVLQMLKDNERKSKMRNQHLLQDFEKVGEYSDDLDSKARKLKRVKQDYENYIKLAYPHWKENVEICEMTKAKAPFKGLDFKRDRCISSRQRRPKSPLQKQRLMDTILSPISSSAKAFDSDLQLGPMQYDKRNQYLSPDGFSRPSFQMSDAFVHANEPIQGGKEALNFVHAMHHDEQHTFGSDIDGNGNHHDSQMPMFDPNGRLSSTGYNHIPQPPRLNQLNSQRTEEGTDISSFKILPQALALSPNGQLVLLPMAVSPQLGLSKDYRNETEVSGMNSKFWDLDGSNRDEKRLMDVTGKHLKRDVDTCSKCPENTSTQVRGNVAISRLESEELSGSSKIKEEKLCHSKVQEFSEQPLGSFNEYKVDLGELGREEGVVGHMGMISEEYHLSGKPTVNRKEVVPDDITSHGHINSRNHLLLKPESHSMNENQDNTRIHGQMSNAEEADSKGGASNSVSVETSYDKLNSKEQESYSASLTLKDSQNESAKENIRLAVDIANDFLLERERENDSFDLDNGIRNLNQKNDMLRTEETSAQVDVDAKGNESPDLLKSQFSCDGSSKVQDTEKIRSNVEATNINSNTLQCIDSNSASRLDSNGVVSKVEEYHTGGNEKGVSGSTEQYYDNSIEKKVAKIGVSEKKKRVVDIPEISYLFEEIENRMEDMSHNDFYCTQVEETSDDSLKKIEKALLLQESLDEFATSDLCTFSRLSVTDFVGRNSKTGCIVQIDKDLSKIYTLDGFRDVLLGDFEELWEYVFNHMELLASSHIFENPTVCELFSNILCPGNSNIAFEVSQAVLRIMDGVDDSIRYEDDQEYSSEESNTDKDMANGQPHVEASHGILSTKLQDRRVVEDRPAISSGRPFNEPTISSDRRTKESFGAANTDILRNNGSPEKSKLSKELEDIADLSVNQSNPLNDVGNDDNVGYDDDSDDDESTFDSEKLVPHMKIKTSNQPSNNQTNGESNEESNVEEEIVSETSSKQISKDLSKKDQSEKGDDTANESGDDLEDMLSASLVLDSTRERKDRIGHKKPLSLFEQKRDSFDTDEVRAKQEVVKTPQKQGILSPQHSRSISSKFCKPDFWDNSDTESEADEINISVENKLVHQNASEDEFDFEFYK